LKPLYWPQKQHSHELRLPYGTVEFSLQNQQLTFADTFNLLHTRIKNGFTHSISIDNFCLLGIKIHYTEPKCGGILALTLRLSETLLSVLQMPLVFSAKTFSCSLCLHSLCVITIKTARQAKAKTQVIPQIPCRRCCENKTGVG